MDDTNPLQYLVRNEEQKRQLAAAIEEGTATAAGIRQLLNHFYKQSRFPENVHKTGIIPDEKTYPIWQEVRKYNDNSLIELVSDFVDNTEKIEDNDVIYVVKDNEPNLGTDDDNTNEKRETDIVEALASKEKNQRRVKTAIMRQRGLLPTERANEQIKLVTGEYRRLHDTYIESVQINNRLTEQYGELEAELEAERNAHQRFQEEHEAIVYALNDSLQNSETVLSRATIDYQLQLEDAIDEARSLIGQALVEDGEILKCRLRNTLEEVRAYKEANNELMNEIGVYERRLKNTEKAHLKTKKRLTEVLTEKQAKTENPKRILHVMNDFASNGGVGTVVTSLESNLNDRGYENNILLSKADDNGKFGFERIKKEGVFEEFIYNLNFLAQELSQYDIIHIHSIPSFRILEAIDSLKSKGKCPKIVNTCHSNVKRELAAHLEITEDNYDITCLETMINDGMLNNPFHFVDTFWGSGIFRQERIMSLADKVQHMCSAYLNQTVEGYQAHINAHKHTVVHNGVTIMPDADVTPMPKKKRLLYSGRFAKEKGFDKLVEALPEIIAAHPDVEVTLMGGDKQGELVAAYKVKVNALFQEKFGVEGQEQLQKIKFTGWVTDKEEMNSHYQWCDFLLVPSIDESFSLVTAEALNHQRIPIMTNTESLNELYLSNGAGISISPDKRNKQGIAEKVNLVLSAIHDNWVDEMAKTGRELVKERYSLEDSINEQIKVYKEVLKS